MNPPQEPQEPNGAINPQPPSFAVSSSSIEPAPTSTPMPQPPALSSMPVDQYRAVYGSNAPQTPQVTPSSVPSQAQQPVTPYPVASPPIVAPIIEPQPQTVQDQLNSALAPSLTPLRRKHSKRLAVLVSAVAIVLLGTSGYVFAFYLPNRPENVWNAGLQNTGAGLDALVNDSLTSQNLDRFSQYELGGSFSSSSGTSVASGTLSTKADSTTSDSTLNVTTNLNGTDANVNSEIITALSKGSPYPTIYVKATGLKSLGLDELLPGIEQYDGTWIIIPSAYVEELLRSNVTSAPALTHSVTKEDVSSAVKVAARVTNEYVFSTQKDTAVLSRKQFVAHEQKNGRDSYHYKATINQNHAKAYCAALTDALSKTTLYTKLGYDENSTSSQVKNCQSQTTKTNSTSVFDIWIDSTLRVLSAARFPDTTTHVAGNYTEVGQKFSDMSKVALYLTNHGADSDAETVTAALDKKTLALASTFDIATTDQDTGNASKTNGTFDFKPYTGSIVTQMPDRSLDIRDLLGSPTANP